MTEKFEGNKYFPIEGKLPKIIEYFVQVYGEKYREKITNNLNNAIFIFVDKIDNVNFWPAADLKIQQSILKADIENKLKFIENNLLFGEDIRGCLNNIVLGRAGGYNISTVDKNYPNKTISVCVNNSYFFLIDEYLIHEMGHIIQAHATLKNSVFSHKDGFILQKVNFNQQGVFDNRGVYEILNEVVNEYLSQKVVKLLNKDNFNIGAKESGNVVYRDLFPLLGGFIEDNLQDMVDYVMSDKAEVKLEILTQKDFDRLAVIAKDNFKLLKFHGELIKKELKAKSENADLFELAQKKRRAWSIYTWSYLETFREAEEIFNKIEERKLDCGLEKENY